MDCELCRYRQTGPQPDQTRAAPPQFISHKLLSDLSSENCGVALENNAVMRAGALRAHDQPPGHHCIREERLMIYDPVKNAVTDPPTPDRDITTRSCYHFIGL